MIHEPATDKRIPHTVRHQADLIVVGGGLSGVCCALTAARAGSKVVLVQDRPVLGGNSSSEVRLWVLGATSHMGNNNRWAREGGVLDEILVENMYRNPEGNAVIFDTILLDKVFSEPNITLLLNTAVTEVEKETTDRIKRLRAFCSQNQTAYELTAPLFCDASGDGIVGFLAGAAFRMGAESRDEFGEKFAPSQEYGELLGHSLYFYSKDTGKPVRFVPPSFALDDITKIPRFRSFNSQDYGCRLWWIEWGGRLDTVRETETIKWELWKVVYGVWNHIKNSGQFPEAKNLTLEWVGTIPGKRESRRFEGDYLLKQSDIVEQRHFSDAVAFGGWSIDLHPADGVFSEKPGCNQWHSKGIYPIPYRCLYSRNVSNLFLAGRIISATHVAFGSTRVMGTSAYAAQAVGMAAHLCVRLGLQPRDLLTDSRMEQLQSALIRSGQYIPGIQIRDEADLVQKAKLTVSSELALDELPETGDHEVLAESVAQLIPVGPGPMPRLVIHAYTDEPTELEVQLRRSLKAANYTPDQTLTTLKLALHPGRNCLPLEFDATFDEPTYAFLCLMKNERVQVPRSQMRITGLLSVFNTINPAVSNWGSQQPTDDIGVDAFEFWCPKRRPAGHNVAVKFFPALSVFGAENIRNGIARPTTQPNAWVAAPTDTRPTLTLTWDKPQTIRQIELSFDTDFDHPMETVLMTHPEAVMPFCVRNYRLLDENGIVIAAKTDNYQTRTTIHLNEAVTTSRLIVELEHPGANTPAALFEIRCY